MRHVSGRVLTEDGFIDGHVSFEDGVVVEVAEGDVEDPLATGIVIPGLVDAHTHLADHIVPLDTSLTLAELVAPPDGLKHRVLGSCGRAAMESSVARATELMLSRGVTGHVDFREGGVDGVEAMRSVPFRRLLLGRPSSERYDEDEVRELLRHADGVAVSGMAEWDPDELELLSDHVRSEGRPFAMHLSECEREDVGAALDLGPHHLVHMCNATDEDMEEVASARVPVISCPRSNMFFGQVPPLARMLDAGLEVALGTDNAMVCAPDMIAEMEFAARILRSQGVHSVAPALVMGLTNSRKILIGDGTINIASGTPCDLVVIEDRGGGPETDLALRTSAADVRLVCSGGTIRRGDR